MEVVEKPNVSENDPFSDSPVNLVWEELLCSNKRAHDNCPRQQMMSRDLITHLSCASELFMWLIRYNPEVLIQ